MMERLQKVMAEAGIDSRRHCEEIIAEGRVTVNGVVVTELPCMVDKYKDRIIVDERRIRFDKKVYYLLHKPKKVICTNHDPDNRRRTVDLLPGVKERVYSVGRLDADSQGLVLMTNDGELANELTHPRYGVPKTYIAEIDACIDGNDIERLKRGFFISRDGIASMDSVKVIKRERKYSLIEITLREGRNRQIRRMLQKLGYEVKKLTRVAFGPLTLRGCGIGKHRELKPQEVEELKKSVEKYKAVALADSKKKRKMPALPKPAAPKETEEFTLPKPKPKRELRAGKAVKPVKSSLEQDNLALARKIIGGGKGTAKRIAKSSVYGTAPSARSKSSGGTTSSAASSRTRSAGYKPVRKSASPRNQRKK